jgi:hypothetical protein
LVAYLGYGLLVVVASADILQQFLRRKADELQASRARVVAAADGERHRIERDLHDGAQQHLTSVAVKLLLAGQLAGQDPALASLLAEIGAEVRDTAQELRSLTHGIYPPLLREQGLASALSATASHCPLLTRVQAGSLGRYPADVEAAVYFCCLEAIQNAGKHAGDRARIRLRVREEHGTLAFEVTDDGAGFDAAGRGLGAGFLNMADRLGAFGGHLRVDSAPGQGTRVTGTVPLPDSFEARGGSRGQCRSDVGRYRHVRALEAAERAERSELDVLEQLRSEQWRADAVVEPDVGPPPEVRRVGWLNGMLVRLGHDRRGIVDARVFRPHNLQPDPVADRHPAPVARRAPPLLPGRGHRGIQIVVPVMVPGIALKDPVSHDLPG